jgi:hypothetical protein
VISVIFCHIMNDVTCVVPLKYEFSVYVWQEEKYSYLYNVSTCFSERWLWRYIDLKLMISIYR